MRSRSSVVGPGRRPWSRSACRTQLRSVSPEQPIFSAIERIANHCEACSPWWSRTIRTARARTSGEYGGTRFVMAPSSQELEPPENPGRFTAFLKGLVKRGLKGVKLVISDAHEGLRLAITRVLGAPWQRCRVHWMRNALAHVPKGQHTMVAAAIRQAFLQPDAEAAHQTWRHVADQLRPRWPKLATLMDDSEHDVLAYMAFPGQHRTKLHSTNPLERLNKEVKRRADVVGIFPNEASITRLIGAVLLEQNDEWLLQHRYMQVEEMAELTPPLIDPDPAKLPPMAA